MKDEVQKTTAPLVLFKITKKEYIKDIITKGHFYFSLAKFFRNKAYENPESYIYDIDECSQTRKISMYIQDPSDKQYELMFDSSHGHAAVNRNQCLFCTYSVQKAINKDNWNPSKKCYECIIPSNVITELYNNENIDDYGLLILEFPHKTLNKIDNELKKQNIIGAQGHVAYDDHDFIPKSDVHTIEYGLEVAFHKRKRFQNQKEFRIVTININDQPLDSIYVGPLEDDEYTTYPLKKDKNLVVEIYPYINEWITDDLLGISIDHIDVNWI